MLEKSKKVAKTPQGSGSEEDSWGLEGTVAYGQIGDIEWREVKLSQSLPVAGAWRMQWGAFPSTSASQRDENQA